MGATAPRNGVLGVEAETTAGASSYYERDNQGTLVSEHTPDGDFYFAFDSIGSAIGLVDATGVQKAAYSYDPYGAKKRHPLLGSVELVGGSFTLVFAATVGVATCEGVVSCVAAATGVGLGIDLIDAGFRNLGAYDCPGPAW